MEAHSDVELAVDKVCPSRGLFIWVLGAFCQHYVKSLVPSEIEASFALLIQNYTEYLQLQFSEMPCGTQTTVFLMEVCSFSPLQLFSKWSWGKNSEVPISDGFL